MATTLPQWDRTQTPAMVEVEDYGLPVAGFVAAVDGDRWLSILAITERLTAAGYWPTAWRQIQREAAVLRLLARLGWRGLDAPLIAPRRLPDDTTVYKLTRRLRSDELAAVHAAIQREGDQAVAQLQAIADYVRRENARQSDEAAANMSR